MGVMLPVVGTPIQRDLNEKSHPIRCREIGERSPNIFRVGSSDSTRFVLGFAYCRLPYCRLCRRRRQAVIVQLIVTKKPRPGHPGRGYDSVLPSPKQSSAGDPA
jgi:hypothetical protein